MVWPIFHQNAIQFSLSLPGVWGLDQCISDTNIMLVSKKPQKPNSDSDFALYFFALGITRANYCKTIQPDPQHEPEECTLRLACSNWPCQFHVLYLLFPRIGYPTQTLFLLEYGLIISNNTPIISPSWFISSFRLKLMQRLNALSVPPRNVY